MTQEQHPITPPTKLIAQWIKAAPGPFQEEYIAVQAARWGADQRLEAVKHWLITGPYGASIATGSPTFVADLCDAFKPKPPSLKEQAQRILVENGTTLDGRMELDLDDIAIIRRALESLPD